MIQLNLTAQEIARILLSRGEVLTDATVTRVAGRTRWAPIVRELRTHPIAPMLVPPAFSSSPAQYAMKPPSRDETPLNGYPLFGGLASPPSSVGVVYFYEQVGADRIKIGFHDGDDPDVRARQWRTGSAFALKRLGQFCGTLDDEAAAKARFHHLKVEAGPGADLKPGDEWFYKSAELLDFIRLRCQTG